jgi:hypothetical protein
MKYITHRGSDNTILHSLAITSKAEALITTIRKLLRLFCLKRKIEHCRSQVVYHHFMWERCRERWEAMTGWDNGGSGVPGWIAATESDNAKAERKDGEFHIFKANAYHRLRLRLLDEKEKL